MKTVPLYEGAEKKSYYKFLRDIENLTEEEIAKIKSLKGDPSLPPAFADRSIIQTEKYTPVPLSLIHIYISGDWRHFRGHRPESLQCKYE